MHIGIRIMERFSNKRINVPKAPEATSQSVLKSMRGNKSKNTKPEMILRRLLHKEGFRYRVHHDLYGRPDIIFKSKKAAIFVDGCFWHGCPRCYKEPKTNTSYWEKKIARNRQRARTVNRKLNKDGWRVMRVWEHEIIKSSDKVKNNIVAKFFNE